MARYEHLPISRKARDLTVYFEKIVRDFLGRREEDVKSVEAFASSLSRQSKKDDHREHKKAWERIPKPFLAMCSAGGKA